MKKQLHRAWRVLRWPLLILCLAYAALVAYRIPIVAEKSHSDKVVAYIHAQKITMADVTGQNLPPVPDAAQNDATLAGIDANNNGIRDDVELAIFKNYPNSSRIRSAELQYAKALQLELTQVFDSNTLVSGIQEEDRAYFCLGDVISNDSLFDNQIKDLENLTLNTDERKQQYQIIYAKYMTSYGDLKDKAHCDIDLNTLPD